MIVLVGALQRVAPLAFSVAVAACAPAAPPAAVDPVGSVDQSIPSHAAAPTQSIAPPASAPPSDGTGLDADAIAQVITDDLVVRSLPEISDQSTIHPTYLQRGQLAFVLAGPVAADGFEWYHVVPFDRCPTCSDTPGTSLPPIGWVAAGAADGEEAWIAPFAEECTDPQSDPISWRPGFIALACLGDRELVVEGEMVACAGVVTGSRTPAWLAEGLCELTPPGFDPTEGGGIGPGNVSFAISPDASGSLAAHGTFIRITGGLDHADAVTCAEAPGFSDPPTPPQVVVLKCRATLVATRIEPVEETQGP